MTEQGRSKSHDFETAVADAAGEAICTFIPPFDEAWHVERISNETTGAAVPVVQVYVGSIAPGNRKDFTPTGNNISDEASPIYVPGGSPFIVRFTGATAGSINTATIQYEVDDVSFGVDSPGLEALLSEYAGVDDLLFPEPGFPNTVRLPRARR